MSMYGKCGCFDDSLKVFDEMPLRNVSSWNALISGYVKVNMEDRDDSFHKYRLWDFVKGMQNEGLKFDAFTVSTLLSLCGGGAISDNSCKRCGHGRELHSYIVRNGLDLSSGWISDVHLGCCLIDMYSKSGKVDVGRRVFDRLKRKNVFAWTAMINGYVHCAKFDEALFLFREMQWRNRVGPNKGQTAVILFDKMLQNGIKPDTTVVVGVLSACCRSGLTNDGMRLYDSVVNDYNIKPTVEMCACMVDLFGRSGQLDRALNFIKSMPVEPGPSIWGALLSASELHGNSEMQDLAYKSLIKMEPDNSSNYISLSNLYAASKRWDAVAEVRKVMRERGLRKMPGCSWISINSTTHSFFVADTSHPCSELIYVMLDELVSAMKLTSYDTDFMYLMEVSEQ
ncbi:UNVERIFIED_CONTAM: putative pentatricopeptide repeat-containing protein, mitochondrial [Sesamum radiatum]|uniref:Pentatricopeptide repeat-containing protein, mitochondrial n=1 Tax=Sesamum radiatum TaxID=300843 RepID=A0AAW2UC36_SESRA